MALTTKQEIFKYYLLICWDATKAARLAGYSFPNQQATRLMKIPEIRQAVEDEKKRLQLTKDEISLAFSQIANGDLGDFSNVYSISDLADHPKSRLVKKIKTTSRKENKDSDAEIITTEIELHSPQSALDSLAKIKGLYKETSLNINIPWEKLSLEQVQRIQNGEDVSIVLSDSSQG
jgi:phage terminase small subunit